MPQPRFELPPQYDPHAVERPLYQRWLEREVFTARVESTRKPYVIVIPPPNVTAILHVGHGLNNVIQDVLIRFERMRGREAEWLPGTDHAGIATQNVVERLLADEGKTRADVGREAFVARVWAFVRETGEAILEQLKMIGCSCDWSRTRFTFDAAYSQAVREVFVTLWEEGLIYRGHRVIHWCPHCRTALSRSEEHTSELQSQSNLVCRLLLEKKKKTQHTSNRVELLSASGCRAMVLVVDSRLHSVEADALWPSAGTLCVLVTVLVGSREYVYI